MLRLNGFILISFSVFTISLKGQTLDSTINLKEINIISSKEKYLVGGKICTFDSTIRNSASSVSLTQLINRYMPIYIKQDAGGLATIRIRGTSPNHTAIMFNGININSLTLGHSNVSSINTFLFDDIRVQFGSSSSLYGSDAIGGSINLSNTPAWNKGFNAGLQYDIASFRSNFYGIKVGYSSQKLHLSLKAFREYKKNNFPFINTAVRDFVNKKWRRDTLRNAATDNYGFLQETHYKLSDNAITYLSIWYEENWHQVQPNMSTNFYEDSIKLNDEIYEKHLRSALGIKYYSGKHKLASEFGFKSDYQLYQKNYEQIIATKSYLTSLNYSNSSLFKGDFTTGVNLNFIVPDVYSYKKLIKEHRVDLYALYLKKLVKHLDALVNLRESFTSSYRKQFTPAMGIKYSLLDDDANRLFMKVSVSRSYKIPTLNDRFWDEGGDPNLLPETGLNYELNTSYTHKSQTLKTILSLSCFWIDVDNWIQWINGNKNWYAVNYKNVISKGLELNASVDFSISSIKVSTNINYSYNLVEEVKSYNPNSTLKTRQLIYTPKHLGNGYISASFKEWYGISSISYTGARFTESYNLLDGYFLLNATFGKRIQFKRNAVSFELNAYNILNKAYQNQEWFAMPGINYAISIKYSLNN